MVTTVVPLHLAFSVKPTLYGTIVLIIIHYLPFNQFYRVDQKKCPTLSESSGISLQIQEHISRKWSIFLGHPVVPNT